MKLLSLGLNGTADEMRYNLQQDCIALEQSGFHLALDETSKGNYTFIGCNIVEEELSFHNYERYKNILKNYVANRLADLIIMQKEKDLVRKIIDQNYYYFNENERKAVYEKSLMLLSNTPSIFSDFDFVQRRSKIMAKLSDYLDTHHELVVEGFINFRLKEYRSKLVQIVDRVVDDFMMELEYQEFIKVLRYFIDVQEPRIEEVHVLINNEGTYKIVDSDGESIDTKCIDSCISNNDISYDDMLISALISIAPHNIIVHNAGVNGISETLDTIRSVFEGRVIVCNGCQLCKKS